MGDFFERPDETPRLKHYTPPPIGDTMGQWAQQLEYLPQIASAATGLMKPVNQAYADQYFATFPSLRGNVGAVENYGKQLLSGKLPKDVADQITRSSAYQALLGGGDPSANINLAREARNIGKTSLDLMNQGAGILGNVAQSQAGIASSANPLVIDPSRYLISPGQFMQREDQASLMNWNIDTQNQMIDFYNNQLSSPFDQLLNQTIGSVVSAPFNLVSNFANVVGQAPNIAVGFLGGMFGGPGGASGALGGLNSGGGFQYNASAPQPAMGRSGGGGGLNAPFFQG